MENAVRAMDTNWFGHAGHVGGGTEPVGVEAVGFLIELTSHDSLDAVLRHQGHEHAELWTILNDFSIINGRVTKTKSLHSVDFLSIGIKSPLGQWSSPKKVPK